MHARLVRSILIFTLTVILGSTFFIPITAAADGGIIITGPKEVNFSEPGQNAIIAFNGSEEVLILSIDVESEQDSTALHMVPLSSNPSKVEQADPECFTTLTDIIRHKTERLVWKTDLLGTKGALGAAGADSQGVVITFHEQIGAHDVTVVEVLDTDQFISWVNNFTADNGFEDAEVSLGFRQTLANYIDNDIKHFVFDVVDATQTTKSVEPLLYRFETDSLFYPLDITAGSDVGWDYAHLNLFLIAKGVVPKSAVEAVHLKANHGFERPIAFSSAELAEVHTELADLLRGGSFVTNVTFSGPLVGLRDDLVIPGDKISGPSPLGALLLSGQGVASYMRLGVFDWVFVVLITIISLLFIPVIAWPLSKLLRRWIPVWWHYNVLSYALSAVFVCLVLLFVPGAWVTAAPVETMMLLSVVLVIILPVLVYVYRIEARGYWRKGDIGV